jgi:cytochrome c peroxidase
MDRIAPSRARPLNCSFLGAAFLAALVALLAGCADREPDLGRSAPADRLEDDDDGGPTVRVPGATEVFAPNPSGIGRTLTPGGSIDTKNLFFQSVGINGRACVSCHVASQGWTVTPAGVGDRFERTRGLDPIFRLNDGSNSPLADVSTVEARRSAYSMLLSKALIRVGIGIPAGAEFELVAVDDPYAFASSQELSLFRRPLPSANLGFLSGVMWDGRETIAGMTIREDLSHQSNGATQGHAQRPSPLTDAQRAEIVAFETGVFFAQALDFDAGLLQLRGARGGPVELSSTPFHLGINDTLGADPTGQPFDKDAMTLFADWTGLGGNRLDDARGAVARGEALFNRKPIQIAGVRGLNDVVGLQTIGGTCTTCHNTPEVGNHSVSLPLDIGLTDAGRRTPDLPLYTLRNKTSGEIFRTTDPGRALITGKWKDRSLFKGPILRGLAARAPYFHNGSAATLNDAVEFYEERFAIGFTSQEKADLVAFLRSL